MFLFFIFETPELSRSSCSCGETEETLLSSCKNNTETKHSLFGATMVAGIATLKLNLSAFSSSMSTFTASSSSSSFPFLLPMRTPSSSKPRFFSESLRSFLRFLPQCSPLC